MIVIRALEGTTWWYLCLTEHHEPYMYTRLGSAEIFTSAAIAESILKVAMQLAVIRSYNLELFTLKTA